MKEDPYEKLLREERALRKWLYIALILCLSGTVANLVCIIYG